MDLNALEKRTHAIIDYWIAELNGYTLEQLTQKPDEHSWSLGQVGIHLWMSAKGFFFKNAERCLSKEKVESGKSKNLVGFLVFMFGKMPTVKVKMPEKVAVEPRQPETKEQLIEKLEEVKRLSTEYIKRIPQSDPKLKTRHPFLGWLNTAEWITLCNLHFNHHLSQKKRIEKHFGFK
jgi:hypothetical protein